MQWRGESITVISGSDYGKEEKKKSASIEPHLISHRGKLINQVIIKGLTLTVELPDDGVQERVLGGNVAPPDRHGGPFGTAGIPLRLFQ